MLPEMLPALEVQRHNRGTGKCARGFDGFFGGKGEVPRLRHRPARP
jgi:hypothetical protein